MSKRILFGGIFHETHTFLDETTGLDQFIISLGDQVHNALGDGSVVDGFLQVAAEQNWLVLPTLDIRATPSGMVKDEVLDFFWKEFESRAKAFIQAGPIDGIFLVLHGAMTCESHPDLEGELLQRIRSIKGLEKLPLFGVFDLHANFSPRMAQYANGLVAYRENPHIDGHESAMRAARHLAYALQTGVTPNMHYMHSNIVWPPTGTGTADTPMRDLEQMAREFEEQLPTVREVNIVAGFSFADTPDTGVSFQVISEGSAEEAQQILKKLKAKAWELRDAGLRSDPPVDEVIAKLLPVTEGPVVLVEPSDNIGGGAPGDCTGILRAFLKYDLENAGVVINDPVAVQALQSLSPGESTTLQIGGVGSKLDAGPVTIKVTLVSLSDGRFKLEDRQSHMATMCGENVNMGPTAVVHHRGITILLTSRKTAPFDLGQWRSQGINPEDLMWIGVKAAVAHRRAYDKIAKQQIWVDTPGPCGNNVAIFPFKKLRRPIYPLDQ
jgi:microcystin degradation protein MlrC